MGILGHLINSLLKKSSSIVPVSAEKKEPQLNTRNKRVGIRGHLINSLLKKSSSNEPLQLDREEST